jgi:hypothetical protein
VIFFNYAFRSLSYVIFYSFSTTCSAGSAVCGPRTAKGVFVTFR